MLKKHVILFEAKDYGWIAYSTTFADAKRMLTMNTTQNAIFYIFECNLLQQYPYTMKIKVPISKYYNYTKINIYKEDDVAVNKVAVTKVAVNKVAVTKVAENEEYITISYDNEDGGIRLDVKHI